MRDLLQSVAQQTLVIAALHLPPFPVNLTSVILVVVAALKAAAA